MALVKATLKEGIKALLKSTVENEGSIDDVATGLADLIDAYIKSGTVTVPSGVPVQVTPSTGTGSTIAPGIGTIS